jgi:quinoprotein dehydrogenase-associated probable ABC transporter substrate-binding protein
LAQLVAAKLGETVQYTWWSQRKSLVKNSLDAGRCDVLMGVPSSLDEASVTKPYYRSSYVFVSRRDRGLHIVSLNDERLSRLRIGINVIGDGYIPPAAALASRGITTNIVAFPLVGPYGEADPARKIIDAVDRGDIDVAIVWGPVAGFFSQSANAPLAIDPVSPSSYNGIPFTFDISMAVRKGDDARKEMLDNVIDTDSAAIQQILSQFGVPQVQ